MFEFKPGLLLAAAFSVAALVGCAHHNGSPQLSSGVLLDNRDTTVRPQDDFFHYVNGGWIAHNEIPADRSSYGSFRRLAENAEADVRVIVEEAAATSAEPGSVVAMVGALYNSFMAEAQVNAAGVSPLAADLATIDTLADKNELMAGFAWASYAGVKSPLGISVREDYSDPTRYRAYLLQSGLGLPNSDYYTDKSDKGREVTAAYKSYMGDIYRALGYDKPAAVAAARNSWLLEVALASHHRPPEENREYARWYNLYGKGEKTLPGPVAWEAYLSAFGLDGESLVSLGQPEYFEGFAEVLAQMPLAVWKDYMKLRVASSSAAYLDQHMQDLSFNFYSKTLYGVPEMPPRWKRGVSFINAVAGDAVGQIYVREHFPPEAKARMDELVKNLALAYRESIESLDWMGEETRANALVKLEKFTANIGYPDKWKDYSDMEVGVELLANVRAANRWEMRQDVAKLHKPVDKNEWFMNPQTVNAYYYTLQNAITFPAAILQPPFFDMAADDAVNYGAIGAVIGHEIGHGFDDNGSQFDGDGRLHNWWTTADHAAFKQRTAMLVEQYDKFEVLPGVVVNGTLTQGENIGDLAGVSIAYKAYLKSLGDKPAPVLDGYTGEQRFFVGFAQAFQHKAREAQARQQVKTDTHSPALFRVNGTLSNVDGFYQAFDVRPGDDLYRGAEQRVRIW
jgi:endothelin-converting enzyme/putative endopeptidase